MWHGSSSLFDEFKFNKLSSFSEGIGLYTTLSPSYAYSYGHNYVYELSFPQDKIVDSERKIIPFKDFVALYRSLYKFLEQAKNERGLENNNEDTVETCRKLMTRITRITNTVIPPALVAGKKMNKAFVSNIAFPGNPPKAIAGAKSINKGDSVTNNFSNKSDWACVNEMFNILRDKFVGSFDNPVWCEAQEKLFTLIFSWLKKYGVHAVNVNQKQRRMINREIIVTDLSLLKIKNVYQVK